MIVPVSKDNRADWARLCCALWPDHTPREMLDGLAAGDYPHEYLYVRDGEALAFLSLSLRSDYVEGTVSSPVGYIEGIYVVPRRRKSGIARELVEFAGQWSRERGCSELASDCEIENQLSREFHRAVGFREAGVIVHFNMDL